MTKKAKRITSELRQTIKDAAKGVTNKDLAELHNINPKTVAYWRQNDDDKVTMRRGRPKLLTAGALKTVDKVLSDGRSTKDDNVLRRLKTKGIKMAPRSLRRAKAQVKLLREVIDADE